MECGIPVTIAIDREALKRVSHIMAQSDASLPGMKLGNLPQKVDGSAQRNRPVSIRMVANVHSSIGLITRRMPEGQSRQMDKAALIVMKALGTLTLARRLLQRCITRHGGMANCGVQRRPLDRARQTMAAPAGFPEPIRPDIAGMRDPNHP